MCETRAWASQHQRCQPAPQTLLHVIMARRSLHKVRAALSELEAARAKGALSAVQLDVTDEKSMSIEAAAAHVRQRFGRPDVLVNNAGVGTIHQGSIPALFGNQRDGPSDGCGCFPTLVAQASQSVLDLCER